MNLLDKFNLVATGKLPLPNEWSEGKIQQIPKQEKRDARQATWQELSVAHDCYQKVNKGGQMTESDKDMYYEVACKAKNLVCLKCENFLRSCGCRPQLTWDYRRDKTIPPADSEAETEPEIEAITQD